MPVCATVTTGTGSASAPPAAAPVYDNVPLPATHVIPFEQRFKYQTAFYQLVLLAVLAGIGRAVERDIAQEVRDRKRVFSHGNAGSVSQDSQVQQVVGQIAAQVYAAEAATLRSAEPLQRTYVARFGNDPQREKDANIAAEIETAKAQVIVSNWCCALQLSCSTHWALQVSASTRRWIATGVMRAQRHRTIR